MGKLKPCRFCGNPKVFKKLMNNIGVVACGYCGGQVRAYKSLELAVKVWNGEIKYEKLQKKADS